MLCISAIGGGMFSGLHLLVAGVSAEGPAVVAQQQQTALVRSIDLRPHVAADGDAWAVLLFGTAFLLVVVGFLIVWLRGRVRPQVVPVRRPPIVASTSADLESRDPYPA